VLFKLHCKFYRHFLHFLSFSSPPPPEVAPQNTLFAISTKQKSEEHNPNCTPHSSSQKLSESILDCLIHDSTSGHS
jgi:hypothetical protein